MVSSPKNLESELNSLCINPERKSRMRSRSFSHFPRYLVKKRCFVLSSPRCVSKINRYPPSKFVIRPAKLRLPNVTRNTSLIRPAKLNVKSCKFFLLKPATLTLPDEKIKKKKIKFSAPLLTSVTSTALTDGKIFDTKSLSHTNFKSLISPDDCDISIAFDTLSFKQLRSAACQSTSTSEATETSVASAATLTIMNKRESTSSNSCSVQARMKSTVPTDCDDTSIDELASYFDLFVHIPKKMSSMAEMMYI